VTGKLIVDAGYFDSVRYNPTRLIGYADDYYAAPISALTLAPNVDYDSGTVIIKYQAGWSAREPRSPPRRRPQLRTEDQEPDHDGPQGRRAG
jgi:D-alanyl-D-alanine carboxypeptidase